MDKKKSYSKINLFVKVWSNEYKNIFRDSGVIMLFIIAVLAYPLIYAFAYNNELVKDVPIIVVDQNNSNLSRKLISMLDATFEVNVVSETSDFQEGITEFEKAKVKGVLVIPKNFENDILSFKTSTVSVYADAAYVIIYKQIVTAATYTVGTLSAGIEIIRRTAKGSQLEQAYQQRDPLPIETYSLYNPKGGYATYLMPAVLLLILQQTLLLGIGLIGGTIKEKGTNNFIVKAGTKFTGAMSIVLGKSMAYFSIYALHTLYTLVVILRLFKIPMRGSYFDMLLFVTPYIFGVILLGITISVFFKKREHALMILVFTSIPFIFLSGFSWPVEAMPKWQVLLSYFIPSTHAIKGFVAITQKGSLFADVFQYWLALWGVLVLYLITSTMLIMKFSRRSINNMIEKTNN